MRNIARRLRRPTRLLAAAMASTAVLAHAPAAPPQRPRPAPPRHTWTADNGNGTFTNPLFYDEFSDPDLIRVGDDFYLTGTTMHAMPGLPVLHSKDLVNWELLSYACDRLDLGPEFRLEGGRNIYGQGIWAPSFRYHDGTFFIFSNVNGHATQRFTATRPAGPWTRTEMKRSFHDLSVLFDDDGKAYVVWGYQDLHLARLNAQLDDIVPGSERVLFAKSAGMGEGSHFAKINGRYYITSAWYAGRMRMPCARADRPEGPYEVNQEISADETFGVAHGPLHQGGVVSTSTGQWWGFSMMDYNSVGRLTCLSPVTWRDGWPFFGLPGNLGRTPRTWVKPDTGHASPPSVPYRRDDDFRGPRLANAWQWNHAPDDDKWSLTERPGFLRLHALPAPDFWNARNTLTQRAIGPESTPTAVLDAGGLRPGDVAGLGLLNSPYAWIGVRRDARGLALEQFDARTGQTARAPLAGGRVWLRAACSFVTEQASFRYSTDGRTFRPLGDPFTMVFQLRTFQGVRYSLFSFHTGDGPGGHADFDGFTVDEPHPSGFTRPIPAGRTITLADARDGAALVARGDALAAVPAADARADARFAVLGHPLGRVSLRAVADGRLVTVTGAGEAARVSLAPARAGAVSQMFQWTEMPGGGLMLLSLAGHRCLRVAPGGAGAADAPGAGGGASFTWADLSPQKE